ncbi:MAG: hypothetical protein L3J35_09015 [Bacteroidales bacterium]|nr:hypothetical protein [Bacteroidales bacterium]
MGLKDIIISKKIRKINRNVQFHNFETAKSVAILFTIGNKPEFDTVKNYYKEIEAKNINTHALGFVKKPDEIGQVYFGQGNFNFYSEKHITNIGKIKEEVVNNFIKQEFDILINLSCINNFYVEYIFALSKAKFKVSGIINCKYSDLNINFKREKGLQYMISQINHYLNTIKKA